MHCIKRPNCECTRVTMNCGKCNIDKYAKPIPKEDNNVRTIRIDRVEVHDDGSIWFAGLPIGFIDNKLTSFSHIESRQKELELGKVTQSDYISKYGAVSKGLTVVQVRWFDGYYEEFEVTEVRAGNYLLWMKLLNGETRHIPLHQVRWYSGVK